MSRSVCLARCLLVLALLVLVPACSPPIASESIASSTHAGDKVTSGFYDGSLTHNDRERTFTVYIPRGYDGDTPMPLIVALHGGLGTGKILEEQTRLSRAANAHGYIVAYPDGVGRAWNAGSCCGDPAEDNIDDVGFIADMVARLTERYSVDTRRVYATGFSNGAMMTHRVVCERPNLFAGFAAVSGGPMIDRCDGAGSPIPALLIQGTDDPRIPWDGGEVNESYRMAFDKVVAEVADRDSCSGKERQTYQRGDTTCHQRTGCADGATVEYCAIEGGGHQWPGGKTVLRMMLGDNTDSYDASSRIVEFFDGLSAER